MATGRNTRLSGIPIQDRSDLDIGEALGGVDLEGNEDFCIETLKGIRDVAVEDRLGLKGLSARIRGVSQGVLSDIFNGCYNGNVLTTCRRLAKYLADREKARVFGKHEQFVETRMAQGLFRIFDRTRYSKTIKVVQSPEQLGKSRTAEQEVHRNNSGRTILVKLQDAGPSDPFGIFLRDMALACGEDDIQHRKIIDLRYTVRASLELTDLVLIDEFHLVENWPDKSVRALLDYIRLELHCDGKRGVVLIATNNDVMTILETFRKRTQYNIGQLIGRMSIKPSEIRPDQIPFEDIKMLADRYAGLKAPTLKRLHKLAMEPNLGHYGLVLGILNQCWSDAKLAGGDITDEQVIAEIDDIIDDLEDRRRNVA